MLLPLLSNEPVEGFDTGYRCGLPPLGMKSSGVMVSAFQDRGTEWTFGGGATAVIDQRTRARRKFLKALLFFAENRPLKLLHWDGILSSANNLDVSKFSGDGISHRPRAKGKRTPRDS
jgi:3-oxoacyl-[acyl-carrier-protein] synthase III